MRDSHIFVPRLKWDVDCMNIHSSVFMAAMIEDGTVTEMEKRGTALIVFLALCQLEKLQTRHINDNRFMGACKLIKLQIVSTHQRKPSTKQRCKYFVSNEIQMAKRHIHYAQ